MIFPMTVSRPRLGRPRSAAVDTAILSAALDELVERGFAKMTIERVAARAGVARTTVYRRWPSLYQLCLEAVDRVMEHVATPPGDDVRGDLVFLLHSVRRIHTSTRFGQILPQLAAEVRHYPEAIREYWESYIIGRRRTFAQVFERGIQEGVMRQDIDITLMIDLLIGLIQQRALWQVDVVTDQHIEQMVDLVLMGLRPQRAEPHSPR